MRRRASVPRPWALFAGLGVLSLALFLGQGCKSAAEQRADADKEAYELVASRRARLGFDKESFTIDPPAGSLRQRILKGEVQQSEPLRLPQVLEIAAENSRDYQTQREQMFLSALDLTLERWNFKLQKTASVDTGIAGRPDVNPTGDPLAEATSSGTIGFSKLLGTGADVALSLGAGIARQLTFEDGWHPVTNLGLSITQPLLRGFGQRIVLEPLTQAERNLVYAARAYERYRRTYAVDAATRYWRLLASINAVENQEANYKSLETLTARNEALATAGRLSVLEVGQARQDLLSSRNDLIDAQSRLATQLDQFKLFLGLPIEFELQLDKSALEELAHEQIEEELDEEVALRCALAYRLDYLTVLDQFDDRRRQVLVAEDSLSSGLTIAVKANLTGSDPKPIDYDFRDTTWSTTLSWKLPIDMLPERNAYRESLINLQSSARNCEQNHDTIEVNLRDELRTMRTQREGYEIQLKAVDLAQRRSESAQLNQKAGRADTRTSLEAERSLLQARNAATTALIDYNLARLAVWRDLEILRVDQDGIHADEQLLAGPDAGAAQAGAKPAGG
jgi:outer membrane protein TolC